MKTAQKIANDFGVGKASVERNADYAKGIDKIGQDIQAKHFRPGEFSVPALPEARLLSSFFKKHRCYIPF